MFLLFTIGLQFSMSDLLQMRRTVLLGGTLQVVLTMLATTAVGMTLTSMPAEPPQPKIFKADHPFLYVIRHEPSGEWIFVGRLAKP